ncbi:MAG: nucleoside triphosphate pyrophosphohydrolase family protein [Candidatus Saccharimonadales bacterium]
MTLDEYQKKALSTALPVTESIYYRTLGLVSEAGEIADRVKKWIRDYNSDEDKLDKKALASELGDVLWYTATLADFLGFSLDDVANNNLDKLQDRKRRNKLRGSGDNR